jgi:hypothetical protein
MNFRTRMYSGPVWQEEMFSILRSVFPIVVTLVALGAALYRFDIGNLGNIVSQLPLSALFVVLAAFIVANLLASLRLWFIARDFNHALRFGDALVAMTSGQLAGSFFFQIFGQTIARSATLAKSGVSLSATIIMTVYERVVAALVSIALAVFGASYLFGYMSFDIAGGGDQLLKILSGLTVVFVSGAVFVWGRPAWPVLRGLLTLENILRCGRASVVSIGIQAMTMAAYIAVAHSLAPDLPIIALVSATTIVMLAASIPISLAGWGIREISAVYALGAIGMTRDMSIVVALLIGGVSIMVTAVLAMASSLLIKPTIIDSVPSKPSSVDSTSFLAWVLPLFAASAIFFQVYLPVEVGQINVNLADSVVLFGGALFVIRFFSSPQKSRLPHVRLYVGLMTAVLVASFAHGVLSFGWTSWAFANRLFGWLVLISYAATGALLVQQGGAKAFQLLLRTFSISGVAIVILGLCALAVSFFGLLPLGTFFPVYRFDGFAQNPNALAFQLLLVLSIIIAMGDSARARIAMVVILAGLFFSSSRAGEFAAAVLIPSALFLRFLTLRALLTVLVIAGSIITAVMLYISASIDLMTSSVLSLSHVDSDDQHWLTLFNGLHMFFQNPLFGAGLGAFGVAYMPENGQVAIIHSTPIWLLAETGIIGFVIFAAPYFALLFRELRDYRHSDVAGRLIILCLIVFGVMSQFHELLYQRALWLLIGAALVAGTNAVSLPVHRRNLRGDRPVSAVFTL